MPGHGLQHCPVCGTAYNTTGPGGPCSARCAAIDRQNNALGIRESTATPQWGSGRNDRRGGSGRSGSGKPKGKGCPIVLLPSALGVAIGVAMLRRRT